jgi:hypothetical protein
MSSATNSILSTSKRARFQESSSTTQSVLLASPIESARKHISSIVASLALPTQQLANHWGVRIISLHSKIKQQEKTLLPFTNPDFIPRSARVAFQLGGSKQVTGLADYTALVTDTSTLVTDFQKAIRDKIVAVANLELSVSKEAKATAIVEAVVTYAHLFHLAECGLAPTTLEHYTYVLPVLAAARARALGSTCLSDEAIQKLLLEQIGAAPNRSVESYTINSIFAANCSELFYEPSKVFDSAIHTANCAAAARLFADRSLNDRVSIDTSIVLDAEPTVAPASLDSLIQQAVKKHTKALTSTIGRLEKSLQTAKNSGRGAAQTGASLKKKSPPPTAPPLTVSRNTTRRNATAPQSHARDAPAAAKSSSASGAALKNTSGKTSSKKLKNRSSSAARGQHK